MSNENQEEIENQRFETDTFQLTTCNQFGEFCFYITSTLLEEYFEKKIVPFTMNDFLEEYSFEESRNIYEWLKQRGKPKPNTTE